MQACLGVKFDKIFTLDQLKSGIIFAVVSRLVLAILKSGISFVVE